jgi:TPR repeat protein
MSMNKTRIFLLSFFLLAFSTSALADWFLSAETKALIVKADAGDIDAQYRVAGAYDSGKGAPHDKNVAVKWYRMAAERGHAGAQNSLGSIFQEGKKYADALPWYETAAAQGHAQATNSLAYLYDLGLGVPQDQKKGFELYLKAADLGSAEAMWNLANMYGAGQLGKEDMLMACVWAARAHRFARPDEKRLSAYLAKTLPQVETLLSTDELASCRQQAESWSPSSTSMTR